MARVSEDRIRSELDAIERLLARHPRGRGRAEIAADVTGFLAYSIPRRTLLRRIERLQEEGRIVAEGAGRARVYRSVTASVEGEDPALPVSDEAEDVRTRVGRPVVQREPVGYRLDFLEGYRPGHTWYLRENVRDRLHEVGRTLEVERPAGTYAHDILGRLVIDLSWASSRLEGNTYTRLDTQNLIEFGQRAEGKDAAEAQMILNHKAAIELLVDDAERVGLDLLTFRSLHGTLSENLLDDPAEEGRLRTRMVEIAGTTYRPLGIPQQIEAQFRSLLSKADAIPDPFEQAFFVMVHLPYLQPFTDVNKRTSRLGANIPLIKGNLCPLSFVDVPERDYVDGILGVYELNRVELLRDVFVWAYERSAAQYRAVRESMGEPDPLRLRYRQELADFVRESVLGGSPPSRASARRWGEAHPVAAEDVEGFSEVALGLLVGLHEGVLRRYGISAEEFAEWRGRFGGNARRS